MSRSDGSKHGARRRTVLKLFSAAAGAAALPFSGLGQTGDREFAVVQGDTCIPVTPLTDERPVEEFYDWREGDTDYSSAGTTDLQRDDTSVLFLYDGPNGTSLVLVHGHYESNQSGGGSVSMTFTGLPETGEWVVEDDLYDGDQNYDNWNHEGTRSEIDWTYRFSRTDGGAFRGLDGEFELLIEPAFNDASALGDEYYTSELADWQVLSGDIDDPDRTSLAMDQPLAIRPGGCTTSEETDDEQTGDDQTDDGSSSGDGHEEDDGTDGTASEDDEETQEEDEENDETQEEEKKDEDEDEDEGTQDEVDEDDEDGEEKKSESEEEDENESEEDESEEKKRNRRERKHEKRQEKHRKKHEKKQEKHRKKHEKKRRKHEKEAERKEKKHEKRQRKHRKKQRKHRKKSKRKEQKHRKKRRKHRKRERKHEREESDDSRGGIGGLGDEVTGTLDGLTGLDGDG